MDDSSHSGHPDPGVRNRYVHECSRNLGRPGVGRRVLRGLLVGVIAGAFSRIPHQRIAIAMSVGAGLLLAGVCQSDCGCDPARRADPGRGVTAAWCSRIQCEQRASRPVRCRAPQALRRWHSAAGRVAAAWQRSSHRPRQRARRGPRGDGAGSGPAGSSGPRRADIAFSLSNLPVALSSTAVGAV
jgi:hypothetical protein